MDNKERVVHVNQVRPLLRPNSQTECSEPVGQWSPPLFRDDHPAPATHDEPPAAPQSGPPVTIRSGRVVRPVDYYGY